MLRICVYMYVYHTGVLRSSSKLKCSTGVIRTIHVYTAGVHMGIHMYVYYTTAAVPRPCLVYT